MNEEELDRCGRALMASYWGYSQAEIEAEWPLLTDQERARSVQAAQAVLAEAGHRELLVDLARERFARRAVDQALAEALSLERRTPPEG